MTLYYQELCRLNLQSCEPSQEQTRKLAQLHEIFTFLQAAKAQTEFCHAQTQGMQLHTYAVGLLQKFKLLACPTCR